MKECGELVFSWLLEICKKTWKERLLSEEWKRAMKIRSWKGLIRLSIKNYKNIKLSECDGGLLGGGGPV